MTEPSHGAASGPSESSSHVVEVLSQASVLLDKQCRAAHGELAQTQLILNDATRRLLDCFHDVTHVLSASSEEPVSTETSAGRASARLLAASQHMQFSDLVGQLLATTAERVDALVGVTNRLQRWLRAIESGSQPTDPQFVEERRAFEEALAKLQQCGNKRVRQSDMSAGAIDLF